MSENDAVFDFARSMRDAADAQRVYEHDRRARRVLAEAERAVCELCDTSGYRPNGLVCDHVDRTETVRRGLALCRDVLKLPSLKRAADTVPDDQQPTDDPDPTEAEESLE